MKLTLILVLFLPFNLKAQRIYNITGMMATSQQIEGLPKKIVKCKITATITDSTISLLIMGKLNTYTITKKVSENYFKATDGIKDYVFSISNEKTGKYSGGILEQSEMGLIYMFF